MPLLGAWRAGPGAGPPMAPKPKPGGGGPLRRAGLGKNCCRDTRQQHRKPVWCSVARCSSPLFWSIWLCSIQPRSIQFGSVQFNSVEFNLPQYGTLRSIQFNSTQFKSIQLNTIHSAPLRYATLHNATRDFNHDRMRRHTITAAAAQVKLEHLLGWAHVS